ncbi:tRNA (adenosine(37)-N6)-threonylcarbamoyltransferase complex dimerization subunit type 1 TsaB [Williamsoniiplasma lucivorax]|uniref:tRNA N6-adenosine(37)-N6-threonylcarbamoyltransferase complex dimerization subunit TsaB n=1 Tax=Williamsoniiplasma lucivorax TaxID=209274 RepID=A0A2S5RA73_9MOLU|nr:tRNA (adenosine(37)-N6)-threonylcarbamoyltransferase complex dimerization subunit type 1 TsaB [Williamsoniiplasma lucivorax]PPE04092.1 tRNA N6-adenosine(37)-N6-threonylcarbamoyltransferase complex dimerization subunit TsaB [Williamsoniiplasma lucivorax]
MKLFIDTTNWKLIFVLVKDGKIVDQFFQDNTKKVSDIFFDCLNLFLERNHLQLNALQDFYLTTGPGSYTGVRIGISFVKTLKVLNPQINVLTIDTLKFQAGDGTKISLLNARSGKYYAAVFNHFKMEQAIQLISQDEVGVVFKEYLAQGYQTVIDYTNLAFAQHVLDLMDHQQFCLIKQVVDIKPKYIKSFL